jgi:hypothetical protein
MRITKGTVAVIIGANCGIGPAIVNLAPSGTSEGHSMGHVAKHPPRSGRTYGIS